MEALEGIDDATKKLIADGYYQLALLRSGVPTSSLEHPLSAETVEWELDQQGRVAWAGPLALSAPNAISASSLLEMADHGYVVGDASKVLVRLVVGIGGGDGAPLDIVNWLLTMGVDLGVGAGLSWVGERLLLRVSNGKRDRAARRVAQQWATRNIDSPPVLRKFIDSKSEWSRAEVEHRLDLGPHASAQLMRALGFVLNARGNWVNGTSWRAKRARKLWMRSEPDY
ncbi:hypothetical protein [Microbacterium oleivorans]|uniref:hypothetical protein n=1 Tax=Microbacterium oleivorans TaxID=273677 RepID=UPI00203DC54A|nr:hypothetical protein [Microbacterium oleivorans]MCM3696898.1 hypothetical protein [Microbacterium oleivorans]